MRYLVSFACALALVALPLGVGAQEGGDVTQDSEPPEQGPVRGMQRWQPDAYADPAEKSASDFEISYASSGESDEVDPGVRRAKIGIGVSAITMFVGGCVAGGAAFSSVNDWNSSDTSSQDSAIYAGSAIAAAGAVSMISTGILLGVRKRKARQATSAHWRGR